MIHLRLGSNPNTMKQFLFTIAILGSATCFAQGERSPDSMTIGTDGVAPAVDDRSTFDKALEGFNAANERNDPGMDGHQLGKTVNTAIDVYNNYQESTTPPPPLPPPTYQHAPMLPPR